MAVWMMIVKAQVILMTSDHDCGEDGADGKHQGFMMVMLVV